MLKSGSPSPAAVEGEPAAGSSRAGRGERGRSEGAAPDPGRCAGAGRAEQSARGGARGHVGILRRGGRGSTITCSLSTARPHGGPSRTPHKHGMHSSGPVRSGNNHQIPQNGGTVVNPQEVSIPPTGTAGRGSVQPGAAGDGELLSVGAGPRVSRPRPHSLPLRGRPGLVPVPPLPGEAGGALRRPLPRLPRSRLRLDPRRPGGLVRAAAERAAPPARGRPWDRGRSPEADWDAPADVGAHRRGDCRTRARRARRPLRQGRGAAQPARGGTRTGAVKRRGGCATPRAHPGDLVRRSILQFAEVDH